MNNPEQFTLASMTDELCRRTGNPQAEVFSFNIENGVLHLTASLGRRRLVTAESADMREALNLLIERAQQVST